MVIPITLFPRGHRWQGGQVFKQTGETAHFQRERERDRQRKQTTKTPYNQHCPRRTASGLEAAGTGQKPAPAGGTRTQRREASQQEAVWFFLFLQHAELLEVRTGSGSLQCRKT